MTNIFEHTVAELSSLLTEENEKLKKQTEPTRKGAYKYCALILKFIAGVGSKNLDARFYALFTTVGKHKNLSLEGNLSTFITECKKAIPSNNSSAQNNNNDQGSGVPTLSSTVDVVDGGGS